MPKHCAYCGLSLDQFVTYGKFGCEFCIDFLRHHPLIYTKAFTRIPSDSLEMPDKFLSDAKSEFEHQKVYNQENFQLSIRYRIARNFRKQIFPFFRKDTSYEENSLKKSFPELGEFRSLTKEIRFANLFQMDGWVGNILLGDEDGVRFEMLHSYQSDFKNTKPALSHRNVLLKNTKILGFFRDPLKFSHQMDWGYLNSCPTNAGRADRLSLQISTIPLYADLEDTRADLKWNQCFDSNGIRFASKSNEKTSMNLSFSVKNFTKKRKNHFLLWVNSIVL